MTLRITRNVLGLVLLLFSGWASALGLGEIKVNSAMNEPMDAEIAILNLGDLTENEVKVKLAGAADFKRAGVERSFNLTDLKFALDLSRKSQPLIRVTSQKPIKEPYLDFLIEMRWTSGRMLREYTVLMDLPAFAMEKPTVKKVSATRSRSSAPVPSSRDTSAASSSPSTPSAAAPAPKAQAPAPAPVVAEPGTYTSADSYTVSAGDTLWAIASRHRPAGATVQQTIMAIYQSNPEAFINNNSNLVRKGAVLRLPDASEIQNLSHQQAANALKEHTNTWQSKTSSPSSSSAPEATVEAVAESADSVVPSTANTDSGRLRLSAAVDESENESASAGLDGGVGSGNGGELIENELAIAQEELERSVRENAALQQKLQMLEEQVSAMSRLVELEDSGLRGAQLATEVETGAEGALSELDGSADSIVSGEAVLSETTLPEALVPEVILPEAVLPEAISESEESAMAPPASEAESGLVASLLGTAKDLIDGVKGLLLPIGGGLLVLVGLIVMLLRRRGSADEVGFEMIEPALPEVVSVPTASSVTAEAPVAVTGESALSDDEIELDDEDLLFTQAIQNLTLDEDAGDLDLDESEHVDAVGEAEIYLSLGNYDTAVEILGKAVEGNPADMAAHLKLLEVYSEKKDESAFDAQAAMLAAVAAPEVMAEVDEMRAGVFGVAAVAAAEPQADYIELPEEDSDFDLDLDLGEVATTELEDSLELADSAETELADLDVSEFDMDASTELELPELDDATAVVSSTDVASNDLDMDGLNFDSLDMSVLDEPSVATTESTELTGSDDSDFDLDLDLGLDIDADELADITDSAADSSVDNSLEADADEAVVDGSMDLELGEGFDLLDGSDEIGTQLELAQAYVDMGDSEGAREILEHVSLSGNEIQQASAKNLLTKLG